jgi:hypothetical protein
MTSIGFGPDVTLLRLSLNPPHTSERVIDALRRCCGGRDWSGSRDLLIGTVTDDSFDVRRPIARSTPIRCVVHGEVAADDGVARVTMRFGVPILPPILFWMAPIFLPASVGYQLVVLALLVLATFVLLVREVRLTRILIENAIAGLDQVALPSSEESSMRADRSSPEQ